MELYGVELVIVTVVEEEERVYEPVDEWDVLNKINVSERKRKSECLSDKSLATGEGNECNVVIKDLKESECLWKVIGGRGRR